MRCPAQAFRALSRRLTSHHCSERQYCPRCRVDLANRHLVMVQVAHCCADVMGETGHLPCWYGEALKAVRCTDFR